MEEQLVVDITDWTETDRAKLRAAIKSVLAERAEADSESETADHGWTKASQITFKSRLAETGGTVQVKAFEAAIENGGKVSRTEVYNLGGYEEGRSLKGFSRPVNRVVKRMKDRGEIPEHAWAPFKTDYNPDAKGYQRARGFEVPPEIVKLWNEE